MFRLDAKALLFMVFFVSLSLGDMEVTVTTETYDGEYSPRNAAVMWIYSSTDQFVKTFGLWANARKEHLNTWETYSSGDVDGLSGATRTAHGTISATWDLTDQSGSEVSNGTYKFAIEFAEHNGTGKNTFGSIDIDGTAKTENGTTTTWITAISADYTPNPGIRITEYSPTSHFVSLPNALSSGYHVSIFNSLGKRMQTWRGSGIRPVWEPKMGVESHLPAGIYYLTVRPVVEVSAPVTMQIQVPE